jgi:hypothetical protein
MAALAAAAQPKDTTAALELVHALDYGREWMAETSIHSLA